MWEHLGQLALQSPVLVALIGLLGLLVGRKVLEAQIKVRDDLVAALKDAHAAEVRAKEAEIAMLERDSPTKLREHVEDMKQIWEARTEQLKTEITFLNDQLEEGRDLSAKERQRLQGEVDEARSRLAETGQANAAVDFATQLLVNLDRPNFDADAQRIRVAGRALASVDPYTTSRVVATWLRHTLQRQWETGGDDVAVGEVFRGPWGPPRNSPEPRELTDGNGLDYLLEHAVELVGTELVVVKEPDVGGVRWSAGWLDEQGRQVAYLTGRRTFITRVIEELAIRAERADGVTITRPPLAHYHLD